MAGTWLTYAEACKLLGCTPEAVRQLALHQGWRRRGGSDGDKLVLVPDDAAVDAARPSQRKLLQFQSRTNALNEVEALNARLAASEELSSRSDRLQQQIEQFIRRMTAA